MTKKLALAIALSLMSAVLSVASPATSPAAAQTEKEPAEQGDEPADPTLPPIEEVLGATERERATGRIIHPAPPAPVGLDIENKDQVELLIEVRSEMGLPSSSDVVMDLMQHENAAADIREYGIVLSDSEREALIKLRKVDAASRLLIEALIDTGFYAGARIIHGDGPFSWERVEIMVTEPGRAAADRLISEAALLVEVEIVVVRSTWKELEKHADSVRTSIQSPEKLLPELYEDFVDTGRVEAVGYSVAANEIQLYTNDAKLVSRLLEAGDLPRLRYVKQEPGVDHAMCDKEGCSSTRSGIELEKNGSNLGCTLGLPLRKSTNNDRDYSTADHCDTSAWDIQLPIWASLHHRADAELGSFNISHPSSSRVDVDIINTPSHRVTNRLLALGNVGQRITGTRAYSIYMINEKVCQSGKHSGVKCGKITDIGISKTTDDNVDLTNQVAANYGSHTGDSGAPVYSRNNPSTVYGWHQGTKGGGRVFSSVSFLSDLQSNTSVFTVNDFRRDWILKLYEAGLSRIPNAAEYNYWRNAINGGACNVQKARDTIWVFFLTSPEFASTHPDTSGFRQEQRIRLLYWSAYGREPNPTEMNHWIGIYNSFSWGDVVYSIIFNAEFSLVYSGGHFSYDGAIC